VIRDALTRLRAARLRRLERRLEVVSRFLRAEPGHRGWEHDRQRLQRRLGAIR
jgi:hypothetical protein